ncbi:MAG: FadR/GntR family transcriptional regulator [Parvularculaceae bacterium]
MRRLYQNVADGLRNRIVSGELPVGARLPAERLLAAEYDDSRPTAREAIIALEIAGLVEVRVGSGVYVVSRVGDRLSLSELDIGPFELLEARRIVESDVAGVAAARIDDLQLTRLETLLEKMEAENAAGEIGERAARRFHLTIAQGTQNSALEAIVSHLWSIRETSPMLINMMNRARAEGIQPTIDDHRAILRALQDRDPHAAQAAMHGHLSRVIDKLLEITETEAVARAKTETDALRRRLQDGGG